MCLIAHVPAGKSLPLENMRAAHFANDDGIGIMCKEGIYKFLGKKALKKAIKTVAQLEADKVEYAIHFRYKTHGDVILQNCHPFKAANGAAYVMHNGVLSEYTKKATKGMSDTAVFVSEYLQDVPEDNNMDYWSEVGRHVGWGNKLCIMTHDFKFILVNGEAGTYRDGIWYSQTYSLPHKAVMYSGGSGVSYSGGYYATGNRSNVWPYHLLDCSCHTCTANAADDEKGRLLPPSSAIDRDTPVGSWVSRNPEWYEKLREKQRIARDKVPTSIVTDSLRQALDRRYGDKRHSGGISDPRMRGGERKASKPLQLTHTPLQSLAGSIPGVDDSAECKRQRAENEQLDEALRAHLSRLDDEGGSYAELEIDVSARGDCSLPGWSETRGSGSNG